MKHWIMLKFKHLSRIILKSMYIPTVKNILISNHHTNMRYKTYIFNRYYLFLSFS